MSKDGSLVVWVNMEDHVRLVSTRETANVAEALKCICINLQRVSGSSDSHRVLAFFFQIRNVLSHVKEKKQISIVHIEIM